MKQRYTKVQHMAETIFMRKGQGETTREIAESLGLRVEQVQKLITRENRKRKMVMAGIPLRPKGRPSSKGMDETARMKREILSLRMYVELLENFLSEAGRR